MNMQFTARIITGILFATPLAACAQSSVRTDNAAVAVSESQDPQCQISDGDRAALLKLDYVSFDQSLPEGGWRKYKQCPPLARELIDAYTTLHESNLQKQQWNVLVWHSGQISAAAGDYADAVVKMEKTLKPNEKPTNLDRIKTLAVPFDIHKPLPNDLFGLSDFLKMKKVIIIGEMHGTSTVPELFGNVVASVADSKSKTLVVLEISQSSQHSIDTFLKSDDESVLKKDPFFRRKYQDGRSSKAMVSLLRKLAKLPGTTVLCMDPMTGFNTMTGQDRDTGMATIINTKRVGFDHTLILTGNIHSSTALGTPWDKSYRPMGYELKAMAKDLNDDQLLNILVRYGKVDSWNCQGSEVSGCKAYVREEIPSDYSEAVPYFSYFVWEIPAVDGHNASIFLRSTTASPPFAPQLKRGR